MDPKPDTKSANLKIVPYTDDELLKITYIISTKFQRLTMLITTGYLGTEEVFAGDSEDPYLATEFSALSSDRLRELRSFTLFKNLKIMNSYVFDYKLTETQERHLFEGFEYIGGVGDFCVEALFPLMQYLKLEIAGDEWDYFTQEFFDRARFNNFLLKFLTKLSLDERGADTEGYGLFEALGFSHQGYTFKQLALMLELETERTARGLASANTPVAKRIKTVKSADGSNRTFIEREEFANYVFEYHKVRSVHLEGTTKKAFITLTGGNIRNSHIYLTKVMDLFPDKYIGGGNKSQAASSCIKLDVGLPNSLETDIDGQKKIFRSRKALKAFFEVYDLSAGDTVVITETGEGQYSLRPDRF